MSIEGKSWSKATVQWVLDELEVLTPGQVEYELNKPNKQQNIQNYKEDTTNLFNKFK